MSNLRYKDYQGSVTFVDGTLLIQILHIDDLITAQCDGASQAQATFEELVDDYIQTCAEMNKSPSKPFKGSFNVRVTPTLHRTVAMQAAESGETLNAFVQKAIEEKVERSRRYRRLFSSFQYEQVFQSEDEAWKIVHVRHHSDSPVIDSTAKRRVAYSAYGLRN